MKSNTLAKRILSFSISFLILLTTVFSNFAIAEIPAKNTNPPIEDAADERDQHDSSIESPRTFKFEDSEVIIMASETDSGILPGSVDFECKKIKEDSSCFSDILNEISSFYKTSSDNITIFPYDVSFLNGEDEVEPDGSIELEFNFKKSIKVSEEAKCSLIHINNGKAEELKCDLSGNGEIKSCKAELDSLSPVVMTIIDPEEEKDSAQSESATPKNDDENQTPSAAQKPAPKMRAGAPLKSIHVTTDGQDYYISKTANINQSGTATSQYACNASITDTVDVSGALYVDVDITYGGESISYDYLMIRDKDGNNIYTDADGKHVGSTNSSYKGRIGGKATDFSGSNSGTTNPANTVSYRFEEDILKFYWRTDGSVTGYGYYAVITPYFPTSPIPDYHLEELEDGTYALVFDRGGDIDGFAYNKEVKEAIGDKLNKISEIRLHKETTGIMGCAFKGLSGLKTVTIPRNSKLNTIGKKAFSDCESLESFDIPATVTSIDSTAFSGDRDLSRVTFASGSPMTQLPKGLFKGLTSLSDVTLPQDLTKIPDNCFEGCTNLRTLDVPDSVTEIGAAAFKNSGIKNLDYLDHVTKIGNEAFYGCKGFTEVSIPDNVTSIGTSAFANCSNVTDFTFEEGTNFPTLPTYLFSGMTKLKNVTLPSNLTKIPDYCFNGCTALQSVDMPDTVTKIGSNAFNGCTKLQDFEISENITEIGSYAFRNCTSLKDMTIPSTIKTIGTGMFYGCSNLIRVQFEDGAQVTSLPSEMFYGCSKLETVKLPDNVTSIPASYFRDCTSLIRVDLPANLTSIGDYAFYNCYNLEDIALTSKIKTIGREAFRNCDKLTEVTIPKSATTVGQGAFYDCDGLTSAEWESGSSMTSLNTQIFYGCNNLESCILPERLTQVPSEMFRDCGKLKNVEIPPNVTKIGSYAFYNCVSLKDIELPAKTTQYDSYCFYSTGLTELNLPPNTTYVGDYAFRATKISEITIPNKVTSVGQYSFASCPNLETVTFVNGGSNCTIKTGAFSSDPALNDVHLKNNITTIQTNAFASDIRLDEIVIPTGTTTIQNQAFNGDRNVKRLEFPYSSSNLNIDNSTTGACFSGMSNVEEIIIDRNITSSYKNYNDFANVNPAAKYVIGSHVNTLDNMFINNFTSKSDVRFEGPNDFTVSTRLDNRSSDPKWSEFKGSFYADENGILYKLNSNGTASVFHIPAELENVTIPATITSVAGKTYTINKIESYAVRDANDLVSLTVESPENISLPQFSLGGCPSLALVNGKDEIFPEEWAEVSLMCGFPVHTDEEPQQVAVIRDTTQVGEGEDALFSFGVSISGQDSIADDGLTYVYPTGKSARLDFAISNESNVDMSNRVIRMYFAFDGDNYTLGNYVPGNDYSLVNTSTGKKYPFKVRATDAANVYYYDISGFTPGDTLAFNNNFAYLSPNSGGGTMRIWCESISAEEAAAREGKVSQPKEFIMAEWYTSPTEYNVVKAVNGNPQFQFTANTSNLNDENIYIKNISYKIDMQSAGSTGNSYAKDYIKWVDFEDELKLTDQMKWNPAVIDAIENMNYMIDASNNLKVRIDGAWVTVCTFSFNSSSLVRDIHPTVVLNEHGDKAIKLHWSYSNTYWTDSTKSPTADLPAITHYITLGDKAILVKEDSDLWRMLKEGEEFPEEQSNAMRQIANKVQETAHYSYSDPQTKVAETPDRMVYFTTGFSMTKTMSGSGTMGMPHAYNINIINSGLINKYDVDLVEDTMVNHYYIQGEKMDQMFADPKWGPYLSIDITSATLCEIPDKTVIDVHGSTIPSQTAQQSGINIPYSGCAPVGSDVSEITRSAKLSIHWNDDNSNIILDVKNDEGDIQNSYTIGEGCDYATIEDALNGIGYVVTYRVVYKVSWDLEDKYILYNAHKDGVEAETVEDLTDEQIKQYQYKLRSGATDTFKILSNVKSTTMFLSKDEPGQYPSSVFNSNNTAYAKNSDGVQMGSASWSGVVSRELSLSKSATVDGQSYTSSFKIPDDTVIDYRLSFTNSGETYDVLPLTDHMGGSQVLLVPVRGNKNATFIENGSTVPVALENSNLDTYTDAGITYYVLDKAGTYKGITIDGRISDTIQVSRANGVADTLMIWYYQNVTGNSTNASSVTRSITYKALADSSRLGATAQQDDGSTVTNRALSNESWLGGHQTHRLYASLSGESEQMQFIKWIVEDPEDDDENLIRHSLIQSDDEVLYKIILKNTGEHPMTLTGARIRDELPSTAGVFSWSKDNVMDIYYATSGHGSEVNDRSKDAWYIDSIEPGTGANTASRGLYYIHWNNDFKIDFDAKGECWIYVKLKFPGYETMTEDEWDNYIMRNNGAVITNYFYIGERQSHVTHELVDITEGYLQKGVLDTGLSSSGKFKSESTRDFYQNGGNTDNGSVQMVSYYTVLYNSGNVRLYLEPMQDHLPKGYSFRGVFNCVPSAARTSNTYSTSSSSSYNTLGNYTGTSSVRYLENKTGSSSYIPIASVTDGDKNIVYKNAQVTASVTTGADGREQVTYTFSRYTNNDSYLRYDSDLKKYYLAPGEAVRFGYNVTVQGFKRTESIANNEISMPVYDKYGLGVQVSDNVTVTPAIYRDITTNDGKCEKTTTEQETSGHYHTKPSWAKNTTEWFSSNVSLKRLQSVPGVQKTVGGESFIASTEVIRPDSIYGSMYDSSSKYGTPYTGTVARTSIVNWMIRAYNEGGIGSNSMEDFWVEDTVDVPYHFTGNYFYDYYDLNGTKITSSSVPIFSLGGRTEGDTSVKISTTSNTKSLDGTLVINGAPVSVDNGRAQVQILRDATGMETLRIRFLDPTHRIPPNTYMQLCAHTQYISDEAVLSKQFYNHVELKPSTEFDPALVSQGKVIYREEEGEQIPYAIESGASVTMTAGYSSAARKQVTELGVTSNTGWSDKAKNSILLPEKFSKFYYDLYVDLPKDDPTKKLVLIDVLPYVGDHSPFVARDYRDSEFPVKLLEENLGFRVWSSPNLGAGTPTELGYDDFTLEVTTRTEFDQIDWEGDGLGWQSITLADGISAEEEELLSNARSFRVVLFDPDIVEVPEEALMGKNYQVHIRFNAELEDPHNADPGAIAWNSFGYRYTVPIGATGIDTALNAEPLKVGVQIPAIPIVNKALKTPAGHYRAATEDSEYRFLIYKGSSLAALNDISGMTESDIASVLSSNSRDFMIVSANVAAGSSAGNTGFLDEEKIWTYDSTDEEFKPTANNWIWTSNGKYTIIELPWSENGFVFSDIQHSSVNNYTFAQNAENNVSIRVTNVWDQTGDLSLEKRVAGSSFDINKAFTFTIHLQDGRHPVPGTFNYIGTNINNGSLTFDDSGNAQIQLKHNQKIQIKDIPSGYKYSITESADPWYDAEADDEQGTIMTGDVQEAVFRNTRKTTSLTLSKRVIGSAGDNVKEFEFEIYVSDEGRELNGSWPAVKTTASGGSENVTLNFSEGSVIVRLKHNESIKVLDLPVGARFETEEMSTSRVGYTYEADKEYGVLTEEEASTEYRNTLITHDIKLSKTVTGNQGHRYKPFEFEVSVSGAEVNATYEITGDAVGSLKTNASGSGKVTISLRHGQTATINNLPEGSRYQIKENSLDYKASYAITSSGQIAQATGVANQTQSETVDADESVAFTNTRNGVIPSGLPFDAHRVLLLAAFAMLFAGTLYKALKDNKTNSKK